MQPDDYDSDSRRHDDAHIACFLHCSSSRSVPRDVPNVRLHSQIRLQVSVANDDGEDNHGGNGDDDDLHATQ